MDNLVIIGGGQAGFSAVAKLRSSGYGGRLTLICGEPEPPYQRPPLSKGYLLGDMQRSQLYFRPESYYADNDVDLRLGCRCDSIDTNARTIAVGGEAVAYDGLLLATGSQPHRLPEAIGGGLAGVHAVRDIADIDAIAQQMHPGAKALIVGGGYIGLEAAAAAAKSGLDTTVVEMAERILQRVAAPQTSDRFRILHRQHGVRILEGVGLERLTGSGRVETATLSDGQTVAADLVVVGIGIAPSTRLADAAGIAVENGIRTDARCRTSASGVWAAGDCASFPYRGTRIRLESVQNAIDQAEAAVADMLGQGKDYDPVPWFWSDQYDTKLQIAGLNAGWDRVVERTGPDPSMASHWYFRQSNLLAVDAINQPRAYMVGKRLLETGRTADADILSDNAVDLMSLIR